LIQTVHICAAAGIRSVIVASAPVGSPQVLGDAHLVAAPQYVPGGRQQLFMLRSAYAEVRRERPILVVGHNARGVTPAALVSLSRGLSFVYHCHDFEGGSSLRNGAFYTAERLASRHARETWVPAPERVEMALERRLACPTAVVRNCPRRLTTLPSGGRLRRWLNAQGSTLPPQGRIIVRHGRIGPAHCILETIEALPLLPEDVCFVVIGDGDEQYIRACHETAARLRVSERVFFHPFVPHSELNELLVDGSAAMVMYAPIDLNAAAPAPNKVYESMALGLPVVVTEGNSVADDVQQAQAGVAVAVGSRERLAEALSRVLEPEASAVYGRAAREAHLQLYNYESQLQNTALGRLMLERRRVAC
jgi:glycosyltransferase involved in cell wall biosynthesis